MGRLSDTERAELVRRYHAGERSTALADEYGMTRQNVVRIAGARDPEGPVPQRAPRSKKAAHPGGMIAATDVEPGVYANEKARLKAREERQSENARQDAAKAVHDGAMRVIMANPRPSGERCTGGKNCPFPALFGKFCRQHFRDAHMERSVMGSQAATAISVGHLHYIGE